MQPPPYFPRDNSSSWVPTGSNMGDRDSQSSSSPEPTGYSDDDIAAQTMEPTHRTDFAGQSVEPTRRSGSTAQSIEAPRPNVTAQSVEPTRRPDFAAQSVELTRRPGFTAQSIEAPRRLGIIYLLEVDTHVLTILSERVLDDWELSPDHDDHIANSHLRTPLVLHPSKFLSSKSCILYAAKL
jgi:hypothetical protein